MIQTIQNEQLTVAVKALGAELCRVTSADGVEYLWSGDPAVWSGQSPVLFPFIGRMVNGQYRLNGTTYAMAKHGFARTSEFNLIDNTENTLAFELTDSAETLACWPFRFSFTVRYTLAGNALTVRFDVDNRNDTDMLFSLGAHPAFACPLEAGIAYDDYVLEFETEETAGRWHLQDGQVGRCETNYLNRTQRIPLSKELFADDALIFKGLQSNTITLKSDAGRRAVRVEFDGWPDLGLWSKGTGFVCIEPWFGHDDPVGFDGDLKDKPGILSLPAGETFTAAYRMVFV